MIAEAHLGKPHLPARDAQRSNSRPVADRRLNIEHLEDAFRRGQPLLQRGVEDGQALDRLIGEEQRGDEREKRAGRPRADDHLMAAIEDHQRDRHAAERLHHRRGPRARAIGAIDQPEDALEEARGAALLVLLHAIGLDVTRTLKGLA